MLHLAPGDGFLEASFTDWLQGAGTLVAGVAIILTVMSMFQQHDREQRRDQQDAQDRAFALASQARLVHVEVRIETDGRRNETVTKCTVINNSDKRITVEALYFGTTFTGETMLLFPELRPVIAAQSEHIASRSDLRHGPIVEGVTTIIFMDATGLRWKRIGLQDPEPVHDFGQHIRERLEAETFKLGPQFQRRQADAEHLWDRSP